ncbi:hypothetical protein AGMMS4957_11940 [Bacteroidia bacterium]|nr:hypothetical protein AGMMS4957_11940 [Bacteroidia bacterium]
MGIMGTIEKINIIYSFMAVKGVGVVQTNKFLSFIASFNNFNDVENSLSNFLTEQQQLGFIENKEKNKIEIIKCKYHIDFLTLTDELYPDNLRKFLKLNTPPVLSYIGNLDLLKKKKVAFSGSRKVSEKGIRITTDCVEQLLQKDITIVSGYAKGVDFEAHKTALEKGGNTIIILPEGINSFSIKKELEDVWNWDNVLVISEYKPTDIWKVGRAMQRNNTIIALSDAVIVIEAGETGGSLDAGEKTIQLGKYLFVPEYKEIPDSAIGNNVLLRKGALPIRRNRETHKSNLVKMTELLNKTQYQLF